MGERATPPSHRLKNLVNPTMPPHARGQKQSEMFVRLFAEHNRRIYTYITALLPNRTHAEEVFQNTSVVLWREFEHFRRDGDFVAWGCGIAFNQVRNFRRSQQRDRLVFSDDLLAALADRQLERGEVIDRRRAALAQCMTKLRPVDRELLRHCYQSGGSFKQAAEQIGRPANTVYKSLQRLRAALLECIQRTLKAEADT